jgi:hypothetical protein
MTSARRCLVALALASLGAACAPATPRVAREPSQGEWRALRARLATLRQRARGDGARTRKLHLSVRDPLSGRVIESRGAVALDPPSSLRMLLLGPGGTTALDLWSSHQRYRFAVPALSLVRRGDEHTPARERLGLPVDFLRWWLLRPAEGTLLYAEREPAGDRFVLRDERGTVELFAKHDGRIEARRTTVVDEPTLFLRQEERVLAAGFGCADARYEGPIAGFTIDVRCEGEVTDARPDPRAFDDPDVEVDEPDEPARPTEDAQSKTP